MAAEIALLVLQIGVILFAARIFGKIAKKLRIPSVLGELVAGIIIGPYVLGKIGIGIHGFENGLFPLVEGAFERIAARSPLGRITETQQTASMVKGKLPQISHKNSRHGQNH